MSYQVVAEYDSIYQCICGSTEHTIPKLPDHVTYIDTKKYFSEMKEKCCVVDYNIDRMPEEFLFIDKDETELTRFNYTSLNTRTYADVINRFIISLLTRKNKMWIYHSLRYDISLYTSKLPGDILRIILDFI